MKVALIGGGHPRFTGDFIQLMNQLKGIESADIYLNFWNSTWASSQSEAERRIQNILLPKYNLAKIRFTDQPTYNFPPVKLTHAPPAPENICWWFKRRIGMWQSLKLAFDLIDQEYDAVIRFRPDGMLDRSIDISQLDLINNDLVLPFNGCGWPDNLINDQFAVGTYEGLRMYTGIATQYTSLVPQADPAWEYNGHGTWSNEHVMGNYLKTNNVKYTLGEFAHVLTTQGRSLYTDKHYHLPITFDPTT